MAEKLKQAEPEFVYNEDMEKKFGEAASGPNPTNSHYQYGSRTFANPRALL